MECWKKHKIIYFTQSVSLRQLDVIIPTIQCVTSHRYHSIGDRLHGLTEKLHILTSGHSSFGKSRINNIEINNIEMYIFTFN